MQSGVLKVLSNRNEASNKVYIVKLLQQLWISENGRFSQKLVVRTNISQNVPDANMYQTHGQFKVVSDGRENIFTKLLKFDIFTSVLNCLTAICLCGSLLSLVLTIPFLHCDC